MSYEEKNTWLYLVLAAVVPTGYAVYIAGRARDTPVAELAYQRPLLTAIGISIAASIVFGMFLGGRGRDRRDARDRDINRFGEYLGFYVLAVGLLPAFVLAMVEADHFWIANAIYGAYILNALTSSMAKIIAYRRGL
jgi:hypothetical protein